jgi:hypothetical protein
MPVVGTGQLDTSQQQAYKEARVVDIWLGQLLPEAAVHAVTHHSEVGTGFTHLAISPLVLHP